MDRQQHNQAHSAAGGGNRVVADQPRALAVLLLLGIAAMVAVLLLALVAYRALPTRPFAADDFQWLLNVRGAGSAAEAWAAAADPATQASFARPLVWLWIWQQYQWFGTNAAGFHQISLAMHLLDAVLVGALAARLVRGPWQQAAAGALALAVAALHPAPFEAVVWVSAQSELLAATLLLLMLHVWRGPGPLLLRAVLATAMLGLALLVKESAAIGLVLLALLGPGPGAQRRDWWALALPLLLTVGFAARQVPLVQQNALVASGAYGLGPQLLLNPLRSLALLVAPLPGTERADAAWLVPVGALVLLALLVWGWRSGACGWRLVAALGVALLPTAPFVSPPDSRYLYPATLAFALLLGVGVGTLARQRGAALVLVGAALAVAFVASGEATAREERFAAANGSGGSLWSLVSTNICANAVPKRIIIVNPPLQGGHTEAIVRLACGRKPGPVLATPEQVDDLMEARTFVIEFPGGTATITRQTP